MGKVIPWTKEELNILEEGYKNHESVASISEKINKSSESVRCMASKLGLPRKYPRYSKLPDEKKFWTDDEINILTEGYANYEPIKDIMDKLPGRSREAITCKATNLGLDEKYVRKNSVNFKAEYQDYDWLFQRIIVEGKTPEDIANETGYTKRVIEKWSEIHKLTNRTFKELARLTPLQKSLIIGSVLGDGHICLLHNSAVFIESHAINQQDYLFWKYNILKNLCNSEPSYYEGGYREFDNKEYYCQPEYRFQTRLLNELIDIKNMTRYELIDSLDELGLSVHFLDDAYFNKYQWQICFGDWSMDEEQYYINKVYEKFNIEMRIDNNDNRYAKVINKENSYKLNKIILNNIPNDFDIIKYKILEKVS